jgi:hypothetical protein
MDLSDSFFFLSEGIFSEILGLLVLLSDSSFRILLLFLLRPTRTDLVLVFLGHCYIDVVKHLVGSSLLTSSTTTASEWFKLEPSNVCSRKFVGGEVKLTLIGYLKVCFNFYPNFTFFFEREARRNFGR